MALIRDRDTKLELDFRHALWAAGVRGWRCHVGTIFGVPDLAWQGRRVAVFLDSAWWHGHESRWRPGQLSREWDEKIARTRRRDAEVSARLRAEGWTVLRFWDFELDRDPASCVEAVKAATASRPPRRT